MSTERDLQSKLRILAPEDVLVTLAGGNPGDFDSQVEVDTKGFRSVVFGVSLGEAIDTDVIEFQILESATSGGSFTEIDSSKYLPTSNTTRLLVDAGADDNILSFGATSVERFLKFRLAATQVADDITVTVVTALEAEIQAADVTGIDGKP